MDISAADRRRLTTRATAARKNAYAPHSRYQVGAAVMSPDGRVFTGCNVENDSYGLTICAERVAVFNAVSEGIRKVVAVAVDAGGESTPCGACLQVLVQFSDDEVEVITRNAAGRFSVAKLKDFIPHPFRLLEQSGK